jgi:hypothetical protein
VRRFLFDKRLKNTTGKQDLIHAGKLLTFLVLPGFLGAFDVTVWLFINESSLGEIAGKFDCGFEIEIWGK